MREGISRAEAKDRRQVLIATHLAEQPAAWPDASDLALVQWDSFIEFFCTCSYRQRLRIPLPEVPPDALWEKLTDEHHGGTLSHHPQQEQAIRETVPVPLVPLEQLLLTHGGTLLAYRHEPDLKILLQRGEVFAEPAELVPGEPDRCHPNVARFWSEHRDACAIVTGYALSEEGWWRQHSWLLRRQVAPGVARFVEATISRLKYFGVILTKAEAEHFVQVNLSY